MAVVIAMFSSKGANAQVVAPDPSWAYGNGFLYYPHIETLYERMDHAHAERKLWHLEARLRHDAERGDSAGVGCNISRINEVKYRMAVDEWLIRKNSLHDPGYYPFRTDTQTAAYIAQATRPGGDPVFPQSMPGPMGAASTISITISNAEPAGIDFAINGVAYQAAGGSRQSLAVAPASTITYNGGGSIGQRRYSISSGSYEFRSTAEGWVLYKHPDKP
jgi:hypothetical protein